MVKLSVSIFCFAVCFILGVKLSSKHKQNINLINYLINFNKNLLINLQYQKQDLLSFIKKYDKDNIVLSSYLKQIKKDKISFEFIKEENIKKVVENYFYSLGKSDSISQIEYLKSYENIFLNLLKEYKLNNEKKMLLYPKLGVFSGLIIFIILL